ncbi:MAG: hypothetical protein EOO75_03125 [Myxococcales bacterium]|nr:MAG: hypothetical protein EOO75_03125 [Myxococcales bacterium]
MARLAAVVLGASLLGGCVSEAVYQQSAADARAARSESARREAMLAQLHTQSMAVNERLQTELARQADVQRMLLSEMSRVREAAQARHEPGPKAAPAPAETAALTQRIRQLEQQQAAAVSRVQELQSELTRLQATRVQAAKARKGTSIVQLDVTDPWY